MRNDRDNLIVNLTFEFALNIMDFAEELEAQRKFVFAKLQQRKRMKPNTFYNYVNIHPITPLEKIHCNRFNLS